MNPWESWALSHSFGYSVIYLVERVSNCILFYSRG